MSDAPSESLSPHDDLFAYAEHVYDVVGFADPVAVRNRTVKAFVKRDRWVDALQKAKIDLGLVFFSWLSAIERIARARTPVGRSLARPRSASASAAVW